jgi:hypothetical protein
MYNFEVNGIKIDVKDNQKDMNGWVVIENQSFSFDKTEIIHDEFIKDWPHIKLFGESTQDRYDLICRLASRSPEMSEWLSLKNILYSDTTQMPTWVKGYVDPNEYKLRARKLLVLSDLSAEYADKKSAAAREYTAAIRKLESEQALKARKIMDGDNVLKILCLNSSSLPISLQLAIEGYTPADKQQDISESRKVYAREMLIQFKIALLNAWKNQNISDIDDVVRELKTK